MRLERLKSKRLLVSTLVVLLLLMALSVTAPLLAAEDDSNQPAESSIFNIHFPVVVRVYPSISFDQVWTQNEGGESRKAFLPGESVQINAGGKNIGSNSLPATLTWSVEDPCGESFSGERQVDLETGDWTLSELLVEVDCKGVYTFSMQVEYFNQNTTLDSIFVINNPSDLVFQDGQAFDKCNVGSVSQMQTWWDHSPYVGTNIYIGGIHRACHNRELDAAWVYHVSQQGWSFIPTWVGPQAPCSRYRHRISWDPEIAYQQGRENAEAANAAMIDLGFLGERIIYYDLEAYTSDSDLDECRNAVNWFLKGWTEQLEELGSQSGAYGSPRRSYVSDWAEIDPPPQYVWLAAWIWPYEYNPDVTVWGLEYLSDELWADQQRIRQYAGDHNETYGGVTFNIDSNVVESDITILPLDVPEGGSQAFSFLEMSSASGTVEDMGWLSSQVGWLLANQRLIVTHQAGESWHDLTPDIAAGEQILGVYFLDEDTGWLVTRRNDEENLKLYSSMDGGWSWQSSELEVRGDPVDLIYAAQVQFVDQQHGWISLKIQSSRNFSLGSLLRTVDGGKSWEQHPQPAGGEVIFVDKNIGWLTGGPDGEQRHISRDGGVTWDFMEDSQFSAHSLLFSAGQPLGSKYLENLPGPAQIVDFVDENTGWAWVRSITCSGDKVRSGELGWQAMEPLRCQVFGSLMKTVDGGQTWVEVDLEIS